MSLHSRRTGYHSALPLAGILATILLATGAGVHDGIGTRLAANLLPNCSAVPAGQADPSAEPEPMQPAYCLGALAVEPVTRTIDAHGGWADDFKTGVQMGALNDGDMGYNVFNSLSNVGVSNPAQVMSRHFVNNDHWMVDLTRNNGGAAMSPKQAFKFENGKLVIEGDVAAGIPAYGTTSTGDLIWPEITWSTAPAPTTNVTDNLYLYGQFGGNWASGCRLSSRRGLTCALEADHVITNTTNDLPPCFSVGPSRLMELSGFQTCGTTHFGGAVDFGGPADAWRACQPNQMDMFCRDRFRLEWTKDSLTVYVNGILFMQDAGWPADRQIPAAITSGQQPVYAYFGEWGDFSDNITYRFHWGRLAVNPHSASGTVLAPSPAPTYCPLAPAMTCTSGMPTPMPDPMPAPPPAPTPTPVANAGPTFRGSTNAVNGLTVSAPANVTAGDLLLAALQVDAHPVVVTPPAGWSLLHNQDAGVGTPDAVHLVVFSHAATAAEPASYTFAVDQPGAYVDIMVLAYASATTVDAVSGSGVTGSSIAAPSAPVTAANSLSVRFYVYNSGTTSCTWSPADGLTMRENFDSNSAQDLPQVSTGSTGPATASCGTGANAAATVVIH